MYLTARRLVQEPSRAPRQHGRFAHARAREPVRDERDVQRATRPAEEARSLLDLANDVISRCGHVQEWGVSNSREEDFPS